MRGYLVLLLSFPYYNINGNINICTQHLNICTVNEITASNKIHYKCKAMEDLSSKYFFSNSGSI